MARTSRPPVAEGQVQVGTWGRSDAVLFAMAVTSLVLQALNGTAILATEPGARGCWLWARWR